MARAAAAPKVPASLSRYKIAGKVYEIDTAKLTFGELSDVEEHFDRDFDSLHKAQDLLARVYLAMKRKKPTTTWDDVESLDGDSLEEVEATRPTSAPGTSGTPAS